MFKVPDGEDPYSEIGKYIRNHITAIEDIIATIGIDGIQTNELFLVDEDGDFVWESDWYEGEQNIALIDFFPVSEAEPKRKSGHWIIDGHHIKCNQCGESMCNTDREGDAIPRNFCPNCGTDMRIVF